MCVYTAYGQLRTVCVSFHINVYSIWITDEPVCVILCLCVQLMDDDEPCVIPHVCVQSLDTIQYDTTLLSLCREICFLARHLHKNIEYS